MRFRSVFRPIIERIPLLYLTYQAWRTQRMAERAPELTAMGYRFAGYPAMVEGTFEPFETEIADSFLRQADIFVNIGANVGYYCCRALSRGVRTLAFEPLETNLRLLCRNIVANGWQDNVEIFPLALSDAPGIVRIYGFGVGASVLPDWSHAPQGEGHLVPASTLDIMIGDRFAGKKIFVIMDVEGAEKFVLSGASVFLLRKPRPIWMVEIIVAEAHIKLVVDFLKVFDVFFCNGYKAWTAAAPMRPVEREELEGIARGGSSQLGTHNFIFRAED